MKSTFLLIVFLFLQLAAFCQQTPFHGVVVVMNSLYEKGKVECVPFATVEAQVDKTQPAVTGSDGQFKLVMIGVPEKTRFYFQVKKEGLDVVNIDQLQAVCGQKEAAKIFMAKPQYIADFRSKVYNVGKTSAQKSLEKKQQQLLADYTSEKANSQQNQERIEKLESDLSMVFDQLTKVEKFANDLADKYQRINLDDASEQYREAFRLFQDGKLEGALALLNKSFSRAEAILVERQRIEALKKEVEERDSLQNLRTKETIEELRLKADLHKTKNEWDSVLANYEVLLKLDSTDFDNLMEMALFLQNQNDYYPSIHFINRALSITHSNSDSASLLQMLGVSLHKNHAFVEADAAYRRSLTIYKVLAMDAPDAFLPQVAICLNWLGILHTENYSFSIANTSFQESLSIFKKLAKNNPDKFLPELANTLNNIGKLQFTAKYYSQADSSYRAALKILGELSCDNVEPRLEQLAMALNNLGILLQTTKAFTEADSTLREALKIRRELALKNPKAFLPYIAHSLNNLGNVHFNIQSFYQAELAYQEALKILRELAQRNPKAYLPTIASVSNNLGNLLTKKKALSEAETAYKESLGIKRLLAKDNPDYYLSSIGLTLINLGGLYFDIQTYDKADSSYREALVIFRELALRKPDTFIPNLATILNNLGELSVAIQSYSQAERYYQEALEIFELLAQKEPDTYLPDAAVVLSNLGELFGKIQDYTHADSSYREALKIFRDTSNKNSRAYDLILCEASINFALIKNEQLNNEKNITYLNEGLSLLLDAEQRLKAYPNEDTLELNRLYSKLNELFRLFNNFLVSNHIVDTPLQMFNPQSLLKEQELKVKAEEVRFHERMMDKAATKSYAFEIGKLAETALHAGKFERAEKEAARALRLSPDEEWVNSTLALGYLYQGKWEEAKPIFQKYKGKPFDMEKNWTEVFLKDLVDLEAAGITHPDAPKARALLKE